MYYINTFIQNSTIFLHTIIYNLNGDFMIIKNIFRSTLLIILILFLLFNNTDYTYNTLEFENINNDTMLVNSYTNNSNYINNVNALYELGYTTSEIELIYNTLEEEIKLVINSKYDSDITNYLKLDYFIPSNINRYISFKYNKDKFSYSPFNKDIELNYEDIVTYVNIGLDNAYYSNGYILSDINSNKIDVLVNKYNKLSEFFVPLDLELIDTKFSLNEQYLKKEAALMFNKMCEDALLSNLKIYAGSTYRSYSYQNDLYNKYILSDSFISAETYSARAGYSEHQTGLAVDILNSNWTYLEEDNEEYKWLIDNSYKYGFILRYPKDKELITGYIYEPWHFRYIGTYLAKVLYQNNITYEEYIAKKQVN